MFSPVKSYGDAMGSGCSFLFVKNTLSHVNFVGLNCLLLLGPTLETLKDTEKKEAEAIPTIDPVKLGKSEKAKDLIVVNVGNQVLRKICNCDTAAAMWTALNTLYTETSLPNRIYPGKSLISVVNSSR